MGNKKQEQRRFVWIRSIEQSQHIKIILEAIDVDVITWGETVDQEKRAEPQGHREFKERIEEERA